MKKLYKVQKVIRGWGWTTVGITPIKEQAEEAARILRTNGNIARLLEIHWYKQPDMRNGDHSNPFSIT